MAYTVYQTDSVVQSSAERYQHSPTATVRVYLYLTINGFPYSAFPEYSYLAFSTLATFCRCFRFSQFPTLHFCAADSFLAVSTPAFWCRCFISRCFMSRIFSVPYLLLPASHLRCEAAAFKRKLMRRDLSLLDIVTSCSAAECLLTYLLTYLECSCEITRFLCFAKPHFCGFVTTVVTQNYVQNSAPNRPSCRLLALWQTKQRV